MSTKTRIQYHRKLLGKTNYKKRLTFLLSKKERLVIRKTNKYLIVQVVKYESNGDKVLASVNSRELTKLGWKGSCKNISASYLTGFLLGKKALAAKIKEAIVDLGLQTPAKGSRLYGVLKGVIDAGLNVPVSEEVFPDENRIKGVHISEKTSKEFETLKSKITK